MDPIAELLDTHISIRLMPENDTRVKCILTGHEMAKTEVAINQYINGKRYKRLSKPCVKAANGKSFFYEDYLQYIPVTPGHSNNRRHCNLTSRVINNNPIDICRHISGARFGQALEKFKQCETDGTEYIKPTGKMPKNRGMRCKTRLSKKSEQKLEGDLDAMENKNGENEADDGSDIDEDEMAACVAGEAENNHAWTACAKAIVSDGDDEEDGENAGNDDKMDTGSQDEIEAKVEATVEATVEETVEATVELVKRKMKAANVNSKKRKTSKK